MTLESAVVPVVDASGSALASDVDLPKYSQRELRAKPCCGSDDVAWLDGGGPKTCCRLLC